ncbi:class E sortase [Dietzia psychralcaliphila]|uniref:Class E sortase n=1 Tax=Dietzia psychralcaliphila TaxID=139021 RepID=A0AAD0JRS4_9ACTN|nr:class E sortase [Dietzia psychralcaliphila]AWH96652.1 class E sortase [Dietzia psychralcaliphila]PTM89260.1 LPXTG-site transpeptidase (sortase) family protein [Dietzia psychralcaliphila]
MRRATGVTGVLGEVLVTIGVVLALFVVYQVWWTDLGAARAQSAADDELEQRWGPADNPRDRGASADDAELDALGSSGIAEGTAFARLYIPSFGSDYRFAVVSGTSDAALEIGPGHYTETQAPGEPGNFAVAGHRVGRGSPFNDLDALRSCDALVYATADQWLIYRVLPVDAPDPASARAQAAECLPADLAARATSGRYEGLSGVSVVRPEDVWVIDAVPGRAEPASPELLPLTTLTTCHPQFSAAERLVVHAVLERAEPRVAGTVPAELEGR